MLLAHLAFAGGKAASLNATGYDWLGYSKEDKNTFAQLVYVVHNIDPKKFPPDAIIKKLDDFYYGAINRAKADPLHVDEGEFLKVKCVDIICRRAFSSEELQYKKFRFDDASCDIGIRYSQTKDGLLMGVSAIAYGKGAEFRKWNIADIKISVANDKIRPDRTGKFYVKKESIFRVPAAVVFAILGTQVDVGGTSLEKGIAKAGMAVGLGLLVLQAQGEITGQWGEFNINKDTQDKMTGGRDFIEITFGNDNTHQSHTIKTGIVRTEAADSENVFGKMSKDGLQKFIDAQGREVAALEKAQESYEYGVDAKYDEIQQKIEKIQTERGIAYKAWFKKEK